MKFLLRLSIMLALAVGGWLWWEGRLRVEEQSLARMPPFAQRVIRGVLLVESDMRSRVQMVQSGAAMIRGGKAMIEKGVRGKR